MSQILLDIPEDSLRALKLAPEEFGETLRLLAAAKLYELGRLSSGNAARLAGLDRVAFLHELARIGVPAINLSEEEAEAEVRAARDLAG
jgi:predicted HTH domain antitoxin